LKVVVRTRRPWQIDWLSIARISWIAVTLAWIAIFVAGIQPRYA
jgi:hypothetical protein